MAIAILISGLIAGGAGLAALVVNQRKGSKTTQCTVYALSVTAVAAGTIGSGLGYRATTQAEEQLWAVGQEAAENRARGERTEAQISEIRTPRRMDEETMKAFVEQLKPHRGQKYDMQVFRDEDSLELGRSMHAMLDEAGWVDTNVYPRDRTGFAETEEAGVWVMPGKVEGQRTAQARMVLDHALKETGLYDVRSALKPQYCVESAGEPKVGTEITRRPCSEIEIEIVEIEITMYDEVIPEDTLVLHVGKHRP